MRVEGVFVEGGCAVQAGGGAVGTVPMALDGRTVEKLLACATGDEGTRAEESVRGEGFAGNLLFAVGAELGIGGVGLREVDCFGLRSVCGGGCKL